MLRTSCTVSGRSRLCARFAGRSLHLLACCPVVGQYPRFLRAHWKFLRTVVLKLFEFMHERHPGVQDMAVVSVLKMFFFALQSLRALPPLLLMLPLTVQDTFLKIAQKCRRKFVVVQTGETTTFIEELCRDLPGIISTLESHQVQGFHEAAGWMISSHPDAGAREVLTDALMSLYNRLWQRLMLEAQKSADHLRNAEALKEIQRILRTNAAVCRSVGPSFGKQLAQLYLDMLNLYKALSGFLRAAVAAAGEVALQSTAAKAMRAVKKEILLLIGEGGSEAPTFAATTPMRPRPFPLVPSQRRTSRVQTTHGALPSTLSRRC